MTEYDYSPAAYERYVAQQTRVSNWVNDTLQQSHAWSNPFVLSPTLRDRSFYNEPEHHDQWSMSSSRPSRARSRSYVDHAYHDRAQPRHRTQSHSRSASTPRDVHVVYPQHDAHYVYPQPHAHAPAPRLHTSPPRTQYPARTYPSQPPPPPPPPPPPGQIYPTKDGLYRHPSQSRYPSSKPAPQPYLLVQGGGPKAEYKRGPPIHAPVPVKAHGQQPLFKRILGFMSPVGGRSGNGRGYRGY